MGLENMAKKRKIVYNSAEREGIAISKMNKYQIDRPPSRMNVCHPSQSVDNYGKDSLEELDRKLGVALEDFDKIKL